MNLNDFVVISNKPKSVKLNARNLRELRMETVTLAQESKDMEDRLQQLRESMSREKEERERLGGFRWKSGQAGAVNNHCAKRNKESGLQKLSAGKVKIRLLKDQPQPEVCRVGEKEKATAVLSGGHVSSSKTRLRGKVCGQCEARAAGLTCAECGEDYCVGCFAKFHQKGALKLHRMIPIQTEIQTSVSTLDVVSHFQRQVQPNPKSDSQMAGRGGGARGPERRTQAAPAVTHTHNAQGSQVLVVNPLGEEEEEFDELEDEEEKEMLTTSLLGGQYDEEESALSFQEALRQWRGERREGGERGDAIWRPFQARTVSVEVMGTQSDLSNSGAERGPVKVEFTQHSLSYMDRLLIKRHRRKPMEAYQPVSSLISVQSSPTHTLTAEDVELRRYCASLFAVSSCGGSAEPEPSPGSCLSIEELDEETVRDRGFVTEQKAEDNTKQEEVNAIGGPNLSHNALSQGAMLSGSPVTWSPRPPLVSKVGTTQIPQPDHTSVRSPRSTTASPQPRGPKTPGSSTKTPAKSTRTDCSYNLHQSTLDPSSPSPSPSTPNPELLSAGPPFSLSPSPPSLHSLRSTSSLSPSPPSLHSLRSPSSLSPSPPSLHSLRSTFTLSPSSLLEPESPPLPKGLQASRFIYPKHLRDRLSPPKPVSLKSQSSPSPSLSSALPYSQSPRKRLSSRSQNTKPPSDPLSPVSPGSPASYRSPPKPLSTMSTPSPPDALSSRKVWIPSQKEPLSTMPTPSPPDALSSRKVWIPSQEEPLSTMPTPSPPDALSSRKVWIPSQEEPLSTMPTPSPPDALSSRKVWIPSQEEPLSTMPTPSPPDALSSRKVWIPSQEEPLSTMPTPSPPDALSSRKVWIPSQEEPLSTQSAMSSHPSPSLSLMSDPPPHSSDTLTNYSSQQTPRALSGSRIRKSHSPALFPRMPATDVDMESSSDSPGLTPCEEDSSDEEMKMDGCLEEWGGSAEHRCSTFLSPTLLPEGSPVFLTALDPEPETGELVPEPSMALRAVAQREPSEAQSFCGLEGFLILMDLGSPQPSPRPTHSHPDTQDSVHTLTTDNWMPCSSFRGCAEEHLVTTVMMNSLSHIATPTRRGASSGQGLYTSGRSTPRLSSRPTSALSRPVSGTMSHPVSRPLSRAAKEILDVCLVDQTGCEDPDLEQDIDTQALSSLVEEFRLMATDSDLYQVSTSAGGGAEKEGRVRRRGSFRLGASECHSDEEEETLRDQQSVLSLP
uniref:B box-type domain-containing protein n=1 Tax=Oncorhynchus mykiss TaxID=8022 RepID=A0A8K9Y428_ONCMY